MEITNNSPSMVRVHSECLTGDTLFSTKCDCGSQLSNALKKIVENKRSSFCTYEDMRVEE